MLSILYNLVLEKKHEKDYSHRRHYAIIKSILKFKRRQCYANRNSKLLEGRTDEQKRALVEKVTEAVVETTGAPAQNVTIIIEDMSKAHYATGGVRACDK